jgi:hypothetical protein
MRTLKLTQAEQKKLQKSVQVWKRFIQAKCNC